MDKLFNKLLNELNKLHIDKTEIVVFGSTIWEYFGIREARDIDIIISNKIKILGSGDIKSKIDLSADFISANAKEKLEKAGGTITLKQKS